MREILFRGKREDNGEWVYGDFCHPCNIVFLEDGYDTVLGKDNVPCVNDYEVIPETVGQYTGLTGKNGTKIFEGDILKGSLPDMSCEPERIGIVKWGMFGWIVEFDVPEWKIPRVGFCSFGEYEIIGNIHDNPELLEVQDG